MSSPLSLAEIKELIAYAREQKVLALEAHGVKFQFSHLAHETPQWTANDSDAPEGPKKPAEESKFGHFRPE